MVNKETKTKAIRPTIRSDSKHLDVRVRVLEVVTGESAHHTGRIKSPNFCKRWKVVFSILKNATAPSVDRISTGKVSISVAFLLPCREGVWLAMPIEKENTIRAGLAK